ncbi:MAG: hypothetical protein VW580_00995, partial [Flavobacteriaceae bacterium]
TYTALLLVEKGGDVLAQSEEIKFDVKSIRNGVLQGIDFDTYEKFRVDYNNVAADLAKFNQGLKQAEEHINTISNNSSRLLNKLIDLQHLKELKITLADLKKQSNVSPSRDEVGEKDTQTASSNLGMASRGFSTTYGPTPLHQRSLNQAKKLLELDLLKLNELQNNLSEFLKDIEGNGVSIIK